MSLDKDKMDRSYQFGRLLAVMEKVERDTYDNNEKRETNAERYRGEYCRRPLYTVTILDGKIQPYFRGISNGLKDYLQRESFYEKKDNENINDQEEK